jgi:transposase
VRQPEQRLAFVQGLPQFAVCYDASCGYGWLYDALVKLAVHVAVAHPGQLRLIFRSKRKNDRVDAERLAKLLFLGEVPLVHVPGADVRAWRELINFRRRLIQKRTRAKNAVRRSPTVRVYFERIHRNDADRRKIAVVATAHYLARVTWSLLRNGTLWQERVPHTTA